LLTAPSPLGHRARKEEECDAESIFFHSILFIHFSFLFQLML